MKEGNTARGEKPAKSAMQMPLPQPRRLHCPSGPYRPRCRASRASRRPKGTHHEVHHNQQNQHSDHATADDEWSQSEEASSFSFFSLTVLLLLLLSISSARSRIPAERRAFCREVRRSGPMAFRASIWASSLPHNLIVVWSKRSAPRCDDTARRRAPAAWLPLPAAWPPQTEPPAASPAGSSVTRGA